MEDPQMVDYCVALPGTSDFEMRPSGQPNVEVVAGYIVRFDRKTWGYRHDLSTNQDDHRLIIAGDKEFVVSSSRQDKLNDLLMFTLEGYDHLGEFPSAWFEVMRKNLKHNDSVRFRNRPGTHTVAMICVENNTLVAYLRGEKEGETVGPFPVTEFELLK